MNRAVSFVAGQIAKTRENDYEAKSQLLHALATAGRDDFSLANRLFRNRPALSRGALLHLALALVEMDRKPMASELLELIGKNEGGADAAAKAVAHIRGAQSNAELKALEALAWQLVSPDSPRVKPLVDWLLAHRVGNRWSPDRATGPATMALSAWFAKNKRVNEHYHDRCVGERSKIENGRNQSRHRHIDARRAGEAAQRGQTANQLHAQRTWAIHLPMCARRIRSGGKAGLEHEVVERDATL